MNQFDLFLTIENFKLAYTRLKTSSRDNYKSIYYEDLKIFGLFLEENITTLLNNIKTNVYKPSKCFKYFIPKKDNLVRPLSMLVFTDLLIYQALINVIADFTYDILSVNYNVINFGNQINLTSSPENDKIFFFRSWKKRWKHFNERSKQFYLNGYQYLSEFDIASFYDTIDHHILREFLIKVFNLNQQLCDFLYEYLEAWTCDFSHSNAFTSKHGIPQGPISSAYLADLYLHYLDNEITKLHNHDFKYLRYVDDIRIFAKDVQTCEKLVAALDLISRDLGLIPQGHKIKIKKIDNIDEELEQQNDKFSAITKEHKAEYPDKPINQLKPRVHKKLKKQLLNCFENKEGNKKYLNKTIIGFSLFKLNADEEIKNILLKHYNLILTHFDGLLFYLKKHFAKDSNVITFLNKIINDQNILFHYLVALVFKHFPELEFDDNVYKRYKTRNRHWLVSYYMVNWLVENNKKELILTSSHENHFINRQLNKAKYELSFDGSFKKQFVSELSDNKDNLLALQSLYLLLSDLETFPILEASESQNSFIRYILDNKSTDFINDYLRNEWDIVNSERFFNPRIWIETSEYNELNDAFFTFVKVMNIDASKALLAINNVNHLIFNRVCELQKINIQTDKYGNNLEAKLIEDFLPRCNKHWIEINKMRNQKTDAHPYDTSGKIRAKITTVELKKLGDKQKQAMEELCNSKEWQSEEYIFSSPLNHQTSMV